MDEYRDVESTTRFDGYIFVAHNWNMLTGTDLRFKRGFVVRKTTPTELKGVTALQNENGVIAHIGDFSTSMEFMVAVLVTGEITETGMEIERIRSAYIESVDTAAESLTGRWDSLTRSQNLHADCHNFKARCDNLCDKCKCRAYVVHGSETGEFGNAFQDLLKQKLADLRYNVCLIVWKFGQDGLLDDFWEWNRFSLELASELILHLARNFKETNKCLLWKEKDLKAHRLRNTSNEAKFFRNFLVGGHVHMMYDASQPKDCQTRPVGLFPNKTGVVEIVTLKFYTSPFKVMHQGNEDDSMWRRPKVQEALTVFPCKTPKKPEVDNSVPITNILRYVQCTRNIRESLGNSRGNEARVEAVLILKLDPNARLGREDILKQFLQFFDDQVGPGQMRHLTRFKHEDFVQQIDNTIMAAVNTLEPILLEAQRRRRAEAYLSAVPDIYDLQLALASEAIISFGVYGKLNQFAEGICFNKVLKEELKFRRAVYKNGVPFGGLDRCPAANLVNGLVVYTGKLTIPHRIWQNIEADLREEKIAKELAVRITSEIIELCRLRQAELNNMPVPDGRFEAHVDSVAEVMCQAIIGYQNINPELALENAKLESGSLTCENSRDFILRLFNNPNSFLQVGLAHVARAMGNTANIKMQLMDTFLQQNLVQVVAQKLDEKILQSKSLCLLYPITFDRQQVSLIVPYFGTAKDNYDRQSEESFYDDETWDRKRQVMHEVYNFIYCKTFGEVCRKDFCMEYVLREQLMQGYSDAEKNNGILRLMGRVRFKEMKCLRST